MADKSIVTLAELQKSAVTYQKDLIIMPVISAQATLGHMSPRPGTRGRRVVGQLDGDPELGPWDPKRKDEGGFTVTPRVLETFLGNCTHGFVPNDVWDTVHGSLIVQGEALKGVDIARAILFFAAGKLGKKLNMSIWAAQRDDAGTTTMQLFDGFDTITSKEITAGTIAAAKGNYMELGAPIDAQNAVDAFKSIYDSASDELQGEPSKLYVTRQQYRAYCEDYKSTTGATPYNTEYKKTFLEGSNDLCELVPLTSKKASPYIHLSPQANMLYGYGAGLAEEALNVEKYSSWELTLEAAMYFGVQFESISPERLMVAKVGE